MIFIYLCPDTTLGASKGILNLKIPPSESLANQGVQEPEIEIGTKDRTLTFERVNEVTWKLTDGRGSIAWSGDRGGNYRTARAIAWLLGIGSGHGLSVTATIVPSR